MHTPGRPVRRPGGGALKGAAWSLAREDQRDLRLAQGFDDVEIFLAGNAEDALDAFVLERGHQQIGTLGHFSPVRYRCVASRKSEHAMRIDAISIGHNPPDDVNVIIEVPIGGEPIKYEMDKAAGTLVVDRFLHTPMRY